jgi:hypothetical protein
VPQGLGNLAFDAEQLTNESERLTRPLRLGLECLEEIPPRMSPARDLDDVTAAVQVVVDGVRVRDEIAVVAGQHAVDHFAIVLGRIGEQDVSLGRDEHPEMARDNA